MMNRKKHFSLTAGRKFDPTQDTEADLRAALQALFYEVAGDLGVEDMGDDAFVDYARDAMCGRGVPDDLANRVV